MLSRIVISVLLFIAVLSALRASTQTQQKLIDKIHFNLQITVTDSQRMRLYKDLGFLYDDVNLDSSVFYFAKGLAIAQQLNLRLNEAYFLMSLSFPLTKMGNYPGSLNVLMKAADIAENPTSEKSASFLPRRRVPKEYRISLLGYIQLGLGYLYANTGNFEKGAGVYTEGIRLAESTNDTILLANLYGDRGLNYYNLGKLDSAFIAREKALTFFSALPTEERKFEDDALSGIGDIYEKKGNYDLAKKYYETAIKVSEKYDNPALSGEAHFKLAKLYQSQQNADSGVYYAHKALMAFTSVGKQKFVADACRFISDVYFTQGNKDSSSVYLRRAVLLNDSLGFAEKEKLKEYQLLGFEKQIKLQELEKKEIETNSNIRIGILISGLILLMLVSAIIYRNFRRQRRDKEKIQEAYYKLESAQTQLIQSEKMASLGELTAGIAHEIQNPLNFVNNFSEVSEELVEEAESRRREAGENSTFVAELLTDIRQNLSKINSHGKRADAIVKGMLQHTQSRSGVKELTDINALIDEYQRITYHGFQTKNPGFEIPVKLNFDPSVGKVNIVPQDISRVIVNVLNNALYAVNHRMQKPPVDDRGFEIHDDFTPEIFISTKRTGNTISIKISDTGDGIPQGIIDKIFQPFFTTKPTGQGTGLGLSLAYDIVKAHGGEIKVNSKKNEGAEFLILLNENS